MLILRAVSGASRREAVRASGTTEVASEEAVTVAVKAREDSWEARAVGAGKCVYSERAVTVP
jgi:hypothetical protein